MPQSDFYAGLPLAEQLAKLVEHHHDPAVRHISADEAAIIDQAVARLKAGVSRRQRQEEFELSWQRLEHLYETTVWSSSSTLRFTATSLPTRGRDPSSPDEAFPEDEVLVHSVATPRLVQLALNVVARHALDNAVDVQELWESQRARRSPPRDPFLGEEEHSLLNRALYQPTIAVENSPPAFSSLSEILSRGGGAWVAIVATATGNPVVVFAAAGAIVVLNVANTVLGLAAEGLGEGLKERLRRWAGPPDEAEPSDG